MGVKITVKVDTSHLSNLIHAAPSIDADICDLISQDIQLGAKSRAPVDTGALRDNIERATAGGFFSVISLVDYASFVEFGTSVPNYPAQPHMFPALEAADIKGAINEALRAAGF